MRFDFLSKPPRSKLFSILALAYGLVFCNIGAMVLYEKLSRSPVVFDETFLWGVVSLLLGIAGLIAARRSRPGQTG